MKGDTNACTAQRKMLINNYLKYKAHCITVYIKFFFIKDDDFIIHYS